MISFHPTHQQLEAHAAGLLSPVESLIVSAHCDMCANCSARLSETTQDIAEHVFEANSAVIDHNMDLMLEKIMMLPTEQGNNDSGAMTMSAEIRDIKSNPHKIELDGKTFEVPRSLQRFVTKTGNWRKLVGKLWQAPVELGGDNVAHFIYMENGGSVPEHTHRGNELTLVIDGDFSDGVHQYDTGDFILRTGEHIHAPRSDASNGCLVFTAVDQPLHFTSGLARMLNPFSHLFFK